MKTTRNLLPTLDKLTQTQIDHTPQKHPDDLHTYPTKKQIIKQKHHYSPLHQTQAHPLPQNTNTQTNKNPQPTKISTKITNSKTHKIIQNNY